MTEYSSDGYPITPVTDEPYSAAIPKAIAPLLGTCVTGSGDAMLIHADTMTAAGQLDRQEAADRAELRLWGSSTYVPRVGNRRMAAVGYSDAEGAMIADHREFGTKVYEYVPH